MGQTAFLRVPQKSKNLWELWKNILWLLLAMIDGRMEWNMVEKKVVAMVGYG